MAKVRTPPARAPRRAARLPLRDLVPPTLATAAVLLLFLLVFGPNHRNAAVLKARGVDATATVTGIIFKPGGGRIAASYHLRYRFPVGDGSAQGERILMNGEEAQVRGRRQVPVIYDPEDRSRSALNFNNAVRRGHPDLEFAAGILAALAAVASFWWLFLPRLRGSVATIADRL